MNIENITAVLTFGCSVLLFAIVAGPMNNRKLPEKLLVYSIALGFLGAGLFRLSVFSYSDHDGTVANTANVIVLLSRWLTVGSGASVVYMWWYRCHVRRKAAERIAKGIINAPVTLANREAGQLASRS